MTVRWGLLGMVPVCFTRLRTALARRRHQRRSTPPDDPLMKPANLSGRAQLFLPAAIARKK
jgi:hypothetical protein